MFMTLDRDLFLPADPDNLLEAWRVCEANGFRLSSGTEPLDRPRDGALARAVVGQRALTRASDGAGTDVDLSLVMSGFDFEEVWSAREDRYSELRSASTGDTPRVEMSYIGG